MHLGNDLSPMNKHVLIDNAVNDLNCMLNNLLADFAHCSSSILLALFRNYMYMVVKVGSIVGIIQTIFTYPGEILFRRLFKIPYRTHTKLICWCRALHLLHKYDK